MVGRWVISVKFSVPSFVFGQGSTVNAKNDYNLTTSKILSPARA